LYRTGQLQDSADDGETVSTTEVSITPSLIDEFLNTLRSLNVTLRFFAGSWENFDVRRCGGPYDLVLTSETIYRRENIPSLISAMQAACCGFDAHRHQHQCLMEQDLGAELDSLTKNTLSIASAGSLHDEKYLCLVAAKVIYFGVGGGVADFNRFVEDATYGGHDRKGAVETVWERQVGVGRQVLRIRWEGFEL
jgi:protein-histidine N-methyltransferase